MRIWNLSFLLALGALINFCQAELEGITDEDLKKLVVNEKYVVVLFCEYKLKSRPISLSSYTAQLRIFLWRTI